MTNQKKHPFKDCFSEKLREHPNVKLDIGKIEFNKHPQTDFRVGFNDSETTLKVTPEQIDYLIQLSVEESVRQVETNPWWRLWVIVAICVGTVSSILSIIGYYLTFCI